MTYNIEVEGEARGKKIAPFILIPFVENAIKHSSGNTSNGFVNVGLKIFHESLEFSVSNTYGKKNLDEISGGLGLKNIRKRLDLLYPNKHQLTIKNENNIYSVILKLNWS